jgi:hypothetical protein
VGVAVHRRSAHVSAAGASAQTCRPGAFLPDPDEDLHDQHASLRHIRGEEIQRRIHRLVEIAIDVRKHSIGNGVGEEVLEIGRDLVVPDRPSHRIDGSVRGVS